LPVESFSYPLVAAEEPAHVVASPNDDGDEQRTRQAREDGFREGQLRARAEYDKEIRAQRELVAEAVKQFENERDRYYKRVEAEVVQLALAIARKVLHREAQVDPLLLAGMVRVALSKLEESTMVQLNVDVAAAAGWREYFGSERDLRPIPEVVADPAVSSGTCVLHTDISTTELGIEPQLKEIENGLFDLLAQRPGAKA